MLFPFPSVLMAVEVSRPWSVGIYFPASTSAGAWGGNPCGSSMPGAALSAPWREGNKHKLQERQQASPTTTSATADRRHRGMSKARKGR